MKVKALKDNRGNIVLTDGNKHTVLASEEVAECSTEAIITVQNPDDGVLVVYY